MDNQLERTRNLSPLYICMYVCMYVCVYTYIHLCQSPFGLRFFVCRSRAALGTCSQTGSGCGLGFRDMGFPIDTDKYRSYTLSHTNVEAQNKPDKNYCPSQRGLPGLPCYFAGGYMGLVHLLEF